MRVAGGKLEILERVYFDTASARIQRRSYPLLANVAQVLEADPELRKVRIEGHTDDRGSAVSNQRHESVGALRGNTAARPAGFLTRLCYLLRRDGELQA